MMQKDWHDLISQPTYDVVLEEDVWVPMRDGVDLAADIYRPDAAGKFPALVSWSAFGKDQQKLLTSPKYRPSDIIRATGGHECGEQSYFVPRGYVQVIPDIRGVGKSGGDFDAKFTAKWGPDGYDLIEWVAGQSWCDGNVGMLGMSAFAAAQYAIAVLKPPHLRAIFPFEALSDRYRHHNYHGGILNHYFQLFVAHERMVRTHPEPASYREFGEQAIQRKIEELQSNPDIKTYPALYRLTVCPWLNPLLFDLMLHPYDGPYYQSVSANRKFADIEIPAHLGSRWNGWVIHLPGAFDAFDGLSTPKESKKLLIVPSDNYGGMDRPFHEVQDIVLRWYDHWLKGIDTGIMDEPPILFFIQGMNAWRYENEWPLKVTEWTEFYLRGDGKLSTAPPGDNEEPQIFTSDPWANPTEGFGTADTDAKADPVPKAVYETEPLTENMEVTGPIALHWYAAIESKGVEARSWRATGFEFLEPLTNDTDWYLKLKDIDTDGGERCVAEGWLKASHYEIDESKSRPYAPYHPHSRSLSIEPGEVILYASDMRMTSNVFLEGHRIRLEISGQDQLQFLAFHLPHMAEVTHRIYSTSKEPSYLLLPVIPSGYKGEGEPDWPPAGPFRMPKYRTLSK